MKNPFDRAPLRVGTRIGRYELTGCLGAGGMGTVYEAVHVDLRVVVALKLPHPEYAANPVLRGRLAREARAASQIHHANVARVFDLGYSNGTPYLVMERLDGEDLRMLLQREGALGVRRAADLMLPVLAGVHAAHSVGVLHRDLTPGNLFLARSDDGSMALKVIDFGFTKIVDALPDETELSASSLAFGTPRFMSPEHILDPRHIDAKSDQFALGAILYLCVTGRVPFEGQGAAATMALVASGTFTRPREIVPTLPAAFDEAICRALSHWRDDRFPSIVEFGIELMPFASNAVRAPLRRAFGSSSTARTLRMDGYARIPAPPNPTRTSTRTLDAPPIEVNARQLAPEASGVHSTARITAAVVTAVAFLCFALAGALAWRRWPASACVPVTTAPRRSLAQTAATPPSSPAQRVTHAAGDRPQLRAAREELPIARPASHYTLPRPLEPRPGASCVAKSPPFPVTPGMELRVNGRLVEVLLHRKPRSVPPDATRFEPCNGGRRCTAAPSLRAVGFFVGRNELTAAPPALPARP